MSFLQYTQPLPCMVLVSCPILVLPSYMFSFLPPTSSLVGQNASILLPLGDIRALGRQWAIRAGKEVLQNIDQPTFESVQTCEMLTLYWFSAGESQRNTMFSGVPHGSNPLKSADTDVVTKASPTRQLAP